MYRRESIAALFIVAFLSATPYALPGELLGKDRMFIRFTNLRTDHARILIRLNIVPNDDQPFSWTGKTVYVGRGGEEERPDPAAYLWREARVPRGWT